VTAHRSSAGLLTIVAIAGAGTMVVELAAVRVLAPWFGASAAVWTNVIGVVLLALALGYLFGSRLAAQPRPQRRLSWALLLSALWIVWLPTLAAPIAGTFLPDGVTLDRAAGLLVWGSLAAGLALFGPAALALGCIGPLAVECVQQRSDLHAGTAGGRVLAASTLGSLVGTFGTTHWLVPELGIQGTFYLAAATLAVLGALVRFGESRAPSAVLPALLVASGLFGSGYRTPAPDAEISVLETRQSAYQSLRVVERGEGEARFRQLQVNEGLDSFQSVWQPESGLLPDGYYYNHFALPAAWSADSRSWRALVLGLGAGTTWRVLEGALPDGVELDAVGVEIDPVAVELARRWMDLPENGPGRLAIAGQDARTALQQLTPGFDQIVLDTYANQMEVPPHLCSVEFFEEVEARLAVGGWLTINIGGFGVEDPVVSAITQSAAYAFESEALVVRVPFSRNCVVHLRRAAEVPRPGSADWRSARGPAARLLPPVEVDGAWRLVAAGDSPQLTDDRNPIETLQRASIELAARRLREVERWGASSE